MTDQYGYAKLPVWHYATFDRKTMQFANHPVFEPPPTPANGKPPEENVQDGGADGKPDGTDDSASPTSVKTEATGLPRLSHYVNVIC